MRRAELTDQNPQTEGLHPVLQAALANLDIQLEEELANYRRLRTGTGQVRRRSSRRSFSGSPELISVAKGNPSTSTHAKPLPRKTRDLSDGLQREESYQPLPVSESFAEVAATPTVAPHSLADLTLAVQAGDAPLSSGQQYSPTQEKGGALANPSRNLDDYLESSEELLRSLAEEEAAVETERGFMQSLLTPLGVGSMLLLLLSSTMLGYVLMNPSSLSQLISMGSKDQQSSMGQQSSQTAMVNPQPNLATQEFKDLNLDTLGTLKSDSGSATTIAPFPTPTVNPSAPAKQPTAPVNSTPAGETASGQSTTALTPAVPSRSPATVATTSQPAPVRTYAPPQPSRSYSNPSRSTPIPTYQPSTPSNQSRVAPAGTSTSTNGYPFKVVTHYDNDRTLEAVKKVVPDAYVRNFSNGAQIQLGASSTAAEAEARVQELRNQGISAQVVKQ